jgi:hypothetical protein
VSNFKVEQHDTRKHGEVLPAFIGGGSWRTAICLSCGEAATALHNKSECHSCSDWSGYGTDCTLSGWRCEVWHH